MKLRQKLAVVLATAMAVTAVPVVTMAASDSRMAKEILKVKKNDTFKTTGPAVQIVFKDNWTSIENDEVFYLELENAKFLDKMFSKVDAKGNVIPSAIQTVSYKEDKVIYAEITKESDTSAKVVIREKSTLKTDKPNPQEMLNKIPNDEAYSFPLYVEVTGGDAKVRMIKKGSAGTTTDVSDGWVFATTAEKAADLKIGDLNSFYTKGKLAKFTLTETYTGSFADGASYVVELQDADWEYVIPSGATEIKDKDDNNKTIGYRFTMTGKTSYGFGSGTVNLTCTVLNEDKGRLQVDVAGIKSSDSFGVIEIENIEIESNVKDPEEGKLLADIENVSGKGELNGIKDDVEVANIVKYSTYIKMKDEKAKKIEAGHIEEVEFTIGENVDDSLVGDRQIEVKLSKGHFAYEKGTDVTDKVSGQTTYKLGGDLKGLRLTDDGKEVKLVQKAVVSKDDNTVLIVTLAPKAQVNEKVDNFTMKLNVCVPIDQKDDKEGTLTMTGRALENEATVTAIEIENPLNVTSEEMRVKVGLQGQVGGKVVLTETDKAKFDKGTLYFEVVDPATGKVVSGIQFYNKDNVKYSVEGDIKKADLDSVTTGGVTKINVKRQSKAASTLTLEDFKVTVDRTVPEGKYDLKIYGTAIDADGHSLTVKDFFVVGTPNTEDIAANGLRRGKASFVIGESKYVANDSEYTMDAPSYIQDPGYTMVPVRYVANAFGVAESDILFGKGVVTIFAGERTISLTVGSNIAVVNGNNVTMATAVVNKDGRTYVPAGQIASLLGIKSTWDSATKTATFENN